MQNAKWEQVGLMTYISDPRDYNIEIKNPGFAEMGRKLVHNGNTQVDGRMLMVGSACTMLFIDTMGEPTYIHVHTMGVRTS